MNKNPSIDKLIIKLITIWMDWIRLNEISVNENQTFKNRRRASTKQENLIKLRYEVIKKIDEIFESRLKIN